MLRRSTDVDFIGVMLLRLPQQQVAFCALGDTMQVEFWRRGRFEKT